jgi:hypothetical protein
MRIVKSKYKIWGGFTLLIFLNAIWFLLSYKVVFTIGKRLFTPDYEWQGIDFGILSFFILFQLLLLTLLMTECKYIKVETDKITFINPLLPFLRKTKHLNEFDYMQTVEEVSRGGVYKALWLIKDRKLKIRISSFYYSNYNELQRSINLKNRGTLKINPFKQFGCLLGMKI